jgi:hypothetical protein
MLDVLGQWVYLPNPKTAQKSMMVGVMNHRQITVSRGVRNYDRVWNQVIVPNIDSVHIFTFVRNPWDKVVSALHFLQQAHNHRKFRGYTFQDFVKKLLAVHGPGIDRHFRPQAQTFLCQGDFIPNVFVGRFENLHEDWASVADTLGVERELPCVNKSEHEPYETYYDDECVEIVGKLYAEEIKALGYEFAA